jgi:RNA binding exosome subunit
MAHRKILNSLAYGLTTITTSARKVEIAHAGNMGNTINAVRKNVDRLCGKKGVFDELRKVGTEEGSPDYLYTMTLKMSDYLAAGGKTGMEKNYRVNHRI